MANEDARYEQEYFDIPTYNKDMPNITNFNIHHL